MTQRMACTLLTAALVVGPQMGGTVLAQDPADKASSGESYESLISKAEKAYVDGDYDAAVAALKRAYPIKQNPNLLYNIARIYEKKGALKEALSHYEQFVVAPDVDLDNRREANERIKVIRDILRVKEPPPETTTPSDGDAEADPGQVAPPPSDDSSLKTVALTFSLIGGLSLAAGGVFGALAASRASGLDDAPTLEQRRSDESAATTFAGVADGLYIGGGVLALTGIIIYVVALSGDDDSASGKDDDDSEEAWRVLPQLTGDRVGLGVGWSF